MNRLKSAALAVILALATIPVWAQDGATTYMVRRGDTLSEIARKTQHAGVNHDQMVLGIHRANLGAFPGGNIDRLRTGQVLKIPGRREVAAAAATRYLEGLALERRGDGQGALTAFLDAGEAGDGLAQRKLGQIYDRTDGVVPRDYEASLRWYQKARDQGVAIPNPGKSPAGASRWF
jgi:FimV-like protein